MPAPRRGGARAVPWSSTSSTRSWLRQWTASTQLRQASHCLLSILTAVPPGQWALVSPRHREVLLRVHGMPRWHTIDDQVDSSSVLSHVRPQRLGQSHSPAQAAALHSLRCIERELSRQMGRACACVVHEVQSLQLQPPVPHIRALQCINEAGKGWHTDPCPWATAAHVLFVASVTLSGRASISWKGYGLKHTIHVNPNGAYMFHGKRAVTQAKHCVKQRAGTTRGSHAHRITIIFRGSCKPC